MNSALNTSVPRMWLFALLGCIASVNGDVFYADLSPLGSTSTSSGSVAVFINTEDGQIGYTGMVHDVEPSLTDALCSAPNGCGAHIHAGTSCESVQTQMGHFYDNATIKSDPWMYERYYSDEAGHGLFGNVVNIGTSDVEGRAFIVHSANGTRVACGLLEKKSNNVFSISTTALGAYTADSLVSAYMPGNKDMPGLVYFSGMATALETDLQGPPNGTDCTAPNGCGVHIHSGDSCFNVTTQGGHLYDNETMSTDPWAYVYYNRTDSNGQANFAKTVDMGSSITTIDGRTFILHSNNGTRVSCGLVTSESTSAPAPAPTPAGSSGGDVPARSSVLVSLAFVATLGFGWLG